jgi:hypothetical protein
MLLMLFCAKKDITQIILLIFTIKKFTASELRILMRLCSTFHTSKLRLDYEATREMAGFQQRQQRLARRLVFDITMNYVADRRNLS